MPPSLLLFAVVVAGILLSARCLCRTFSSRPSALEIGLAAYGVAAAPVQLLGFLGFLTRDAMVAAYAAVAALSTLCYVLWRRPAEAGKRPPSPVTLPLCLALFALHGYAWLRSAPAPTFRDDLIYHLYSPACWLQDQGVFIVPQPFGDPAPAYFPCITELLLCLPMGLSECDMYTVLVQWSFHVMCAFAVLRLSRVLGGSAAAGTVAALSFLLAEPVLWSASCHVVEPALTCFLVCALIFLVEFQRCQDWSSLILLSVGLGLLIGAKSTGLALSLPIFAAGAYSLVRARSAAKAVVAALVVVVLGGPFYVRNTIATGNPLYPLDWSFLGVWRFAGACDLAAMKRSAFHIQSIAAHAAYVAKSLGGPFTLYAVLCLPVWVWWVAAHRAARPRVRLVAVQFAWAVVMFFCVLPHNSQVRLLMPAMPLCFLVWNPILQRIHERGRPWLALGLSIAILLALCFALQPRMEWVTGPSLKAVTPILSKAMCLVVVTALLGFSLVTAALVGARLSTRWPARCLLALGLLALLSLWPLGRPCAQALRYPMLERAYGPLMPLVWRMFDHREPPCTIAYTGQNIPYPSMGAELRNRVRYANVTGAQHDRFHHFHQRALNRPDWELSRSHKPAYYRDEPDVDQWLRNLKAMNAEYLAVYRVNAAEAAYIQHDQEGFPIEATWARQRPHIFHPFVSRPIVQVYEVLGALP